MALLNRTTRSLGGVNAVLALLLLGAATSCVLIESWLGEAVGFSHALHVEVGLDCADCHGEDGAPLPPELDTCLMCHEDIDPDKPVELHAATVMAAIRPRPAWSDDVLFGHQDHLDAGLDCASCHGGIAEATRLPDPALVQTMADCTACHEQQGLVTANCQTCHSELSAEVPPANHRANWTRMHGPVFRNSSGATVDDCAMCHTDTSCSSCHLSEAPANHTNTFRQRTHGVSASIDREGCDTCHQQASCMSCHESTRPQSHRAGFGGKQSGHCLSCHFPVTNQSCGVCHQSTPSHLMAAPKPADHSPAMNCRQCHGVDQPLPHVDNGSNCNLCHK